MTRNRVALITGANGAIARATAFELAEQGFDLALADISMAGLDVLAASLAVRSARYRHDAADPDDAETLASKIRRDFGTLDAVVLAAGIYRGAPFASIGPEQWRQTLSVNLDGTYLTLRAVLPLLSDDSAIVTLASMAGHRGSFEHAHYAASKGGVLALTRSLAMELAPRTRVNAVSPGLIDTPMMGEIAKDALTTAIAATPMRRMGRPDEVAKAIAFLCDGRSSFITGQALHVNGGLFVSA